MESTAQWWATSLENSGTFTRSSSIPLLSSVSVVGGGRPRGFYPLHCTFESCHGFRACNCAFVDRAGWYGGVLQRRPKLVRFQLSTPPISDRLLDRWPSGLWSRFAKPASEKIRPSVRIALYPPLTLCKLIGERLRLVVPLYRCSSEDEQLPSKQNDAGSNPVIGSRNWRSGNAPPCHGGVTDSSSVFRSMRDWRSGSASLFQSEGVGSCPASRTIGY